MDAAVQVWFLRTWIVVSQPKKNTEPALKDFLCCFALLLTDFGKSLVTQQGAEDVQLTLRSNESDQICLNESLSNLLPRFASRFQTLSPGSSPDGYVKRTQSFRPEHQVPAVL